MERVRLSVLTLMALFMAAAAVAQDGPGPAGWIEDSLCSDCSPCRVVQVHDAGVDGSGLMMRIAEVALHERPGEKWKYPDLEECAPWEVWLVTLEAELVVDKTRILELCNDGYGASGVGEDTLKVEPNLLVHSQYGGSAWRWWEETTYSLDPLKVVHTLSGSYWNLGAAEETVTWDWNEHTGRVEWYQPDCPELGEPGEWEDEDLYVYHPIPLVDSNPEYAAAGWKETQLGSCSLRVDGTGARDHGFIVHGKTSKPADGSMSVLFVSGTEMIVQVTDDARVLGKKSWLHGDHLEVWVGQDVDGTGQCLPDVNPPVQWGIGLSSGSVFPAFGDPPEQALSVERVEATGPDGDLVRLKITFDTKPDLVTVVFSDSDSGKKPERLLATSRLGHGETMTLGRVFAIPAEKAVCNVLDGKLDFVDP